MLLYMLLYRLLSLLLLLLLQIMVLDKDKELRWKDYRGMIFSQFFRCASSGSAASESRAACKAIGVQHSSSYVPLWATCMQLGAAFQQHAPCTQLLRPCMPAPAAAAAPCRTQAAQSSAQDIAMCSPDPQTGLV
jgi:hypothetical protein